MTARLSSVVLLATLLAVSAHAKDKKKSTLPEYVLRATTVRVVVNPEAAEPVSTTRHGTADGTSKRTARRR